MTAIRYVRRAHWLHALAVFAVLASISHSTLAIPGVFDGAFNTAGVQQLLAICLVFGGLAISYDLLFGHTGILSFGHGMYVTTGMYATTILVNHAGYGLLTSAALGLAIGLLAALVLGAVALRVAGIGFAMVTLAFGQAVSILIVSGSPTLTGGEQGQSLRPDAMPAGLAGVRNTGNLYWIALGYLIVCALVVWSVSVSLPGRVMRALRDNEQRVEILGLNPYLFKLLAFVVAGVLATGGGIVYLLLLGGATSTVSTSDFTLGLLVMVVLGGAGRRWGAIAGGILYAYASQSLTRLSGSSAVASLPGVVRGPLAQPLFLLGLAFVVIVLFVPGGLAGLPTRIGAMRAGLSKRREA
jgi:branched-chain amino acid transport system permease protein